MLVALTHYQQRLEQLLTQQLDARQQTDPRLWQAMRYSLLLGGKRLRPYLVYCCGQMLGASLTDLDGPACAIEALHTYSLIHDDLPAMDNDDLRRGKPTCHKAFDEASAILAGDALQTLAFEWLSLHPYQNVPAPRVLAMVQQLALQSGYNGMCGGQAIDLAHTDKKMAVEALEQMHQLKTGALIECAIRLAYLTSPVDNEQHLAALVRYSRAIGLAFQVQDDILDVEGDTTVLGKTAGSDQKANKATYPALLGLETAKQKANHLVEQALTELNSLPYDTTALAALAQYVIVRQY